MDFSCSIGEYDFASVISVISNQVYRSTREWAEIDVYALVMAMLVGMSSGCGHSKSAAPIDPNDSAAMRTAMDAVETSLGSARFDEALRIAVRLTEVAPKNGDVFELLGRAEIAAGLAATNPAKQKAMRVAAATAYSRAVELSPPSAGLLNAAGVAAQSSGDPTAAVGFFARAAKLDPSNPQHPLFAGLALLQTGHIEEARISLEIARTLDPKSPWPVSALSGIALTSGDAQTALALAREARVLDPRNDELRVPEAKALRKLGRHQEVLTLLLALPQQARMTEAITWEISSAHESLGDRPAAAQVWAKWAEISGTPEAAADAVRRWTEAGDPIQAATWRQVARQRGWRGE